MAAVDLCVFCAECWESAFSKPLSSARRAHMQQHIGACVHTEAKVNTMHTQIKKQRKSSRQGRLTQGRDGRLFIHHRGGSTRTNTASNTGKCDSGVWEVKVYKVQHNNMNWAVETFLIVGVGETDTNQTLCPGCCLGEWGETEYRRIKWHLNLQEATGSSFTVNRYSEMAAVVYFNVL